MSKFTKILQVIIKCVSIVSDVLSTIFDHVKPTTKKD